MEDGIANTLAALRERRSVETALSAVGRVLIEVMDTNRDMPDAVVAKVAALVAECVAHSDPKACFRGNTAKSDYIVLTSLGQPGTIGAVKADVSRNAEVIAQSLSELVLPPMTAAGDNFRLAFDVTDSVLASVHGKMAEAVEPYLQSLEGKSFGSLGANQQFADRLQRLLVKLGFRVKCPVYGCAEPSSIGVSKTDRYPEGEFRSYHSKDSAPHASRARLPLLFLTRPPHDEQEGPTRTP